MHTQCYYVPSAKVRLISHQRLFSKKEGISGELTYREDKAISKSTDLPDLDIDYDSRSHLHILSATNAATMEPQMNVCITI